MTDIAHRVGGMGKGVASCSIFLRRKLHGNSKYSLRASVRTHYH